MIEYKKKEYNDILKYLSFKIKLVPGDWLPIGAAFARGREVG